MGWGGGPHVGCGVKQSVEGMCVCMCLLILKQSDTKVGEKQDCN